MTDQPPSPGRSPFAKKLFLLVLGLVFALAVGEFLTRQFVPDPTLQTYQDLFREDPLAGYRNKVHLHAYEFGWVSLDTNSFGFRGPEISLHKPPGIFRILGLGDSVMWGLGVQEPDTYMRVLERELQESHGQSSGVHFEAINTAVVGYSTYQELVTLERDGLPLCPDLVIVGFVSNDSYPSIDPFYNVHKIHKPVNPNAIRLPNSSGVVYPLKLLTFLRAVAKREWYVLRPLRPSAADPGSGNWPADSFAMQSWPVLQGHIRKLKALADVNDFRLVVLLFPTYAQVAFGRPADAYQNVVGPFLAAEKIPYIDLYDPLRAANLTPQFRDWFHLTAAGHKTTESEIFRYLQQNHWLDRATPATLRKCAPPGDPSPTR